MKLTIGKDIILAKNEKLYTYRNKINGTIYYSTNRYRSTIREGVEFLPVFEKPRHPTERRVNFIAISALERMRVD